MAAPVVTEMFHHLSVTPAGQPHYLAEVVAILARLPAVPGDEPGARVAKLVPDLAFSDAALNGGHTEQMPVPYPYFWHIFVGKLVL
jgi:hypothetical protein